MGDPYTVQFQVADPGDVAFIRAFLSELDVSDGDTKIDLTVESEDPIGIADLLEPKTTDTGLDTLFDDDESSESNGVQKTREIESASSESNASPFQDGSSVPTILSAMDAHTNEWVDIDDVREALSDHPDINLDNLSGRLWSFADSGYLEKQKDGGRNQYRVTESTKERLRAHAQ